MEQTSSENLLELEAKALSRQNHQFWILQIAGWLGYAAVVFLAIIRPQLDLPDFNLGGQILNLAVETVSGFILSFLQWLFIRKIVHLPLKKTLFLSFTSAGILGIVFNIIKLSSYKVIVFRQAWDQGWDMLEFGGWLLFSLATMFVWTSIFFIMLYNTRLQKEHESLLKAKTLAKDAQLQMLRYQLNPHFMFNTMNAISTLILKQENDKANEMLDKLCEFFRYSLDTNTKSKTSLQNELELLELYLSIEKVRFEERLNVDIQVCEQAMKCRVPNMILQPLVENAIKYAVEPRKNGGSVTIVAKCRDKRLLIQVLDDGYGQGEHSYQSGQSRASKGLGIGINNTKARLDVMFNGNYDIDITKEPEKGMTVTISMPMEK